VAFSLDGKKLASGSYGALRLWDTVPEEAPSVLQRVTAGLAFFPDGKTLATSRTGITLWDTAAGKETAKFGNGNYRLLALSHDGKRLAVSHGAQGNEVHLWDLITRQQDAVLQGHSDPIYSLAFSPDDKTLATASYDMTARLWDLATRETRVTLKLGQPVSAIAFSPDGQTLATASLREYVQLWNAATGRALLTLKEVNHRHRWCRSVAFSPDGTLLAAASQTGLVRLWDPATGQLRATLQGHTASVCCIAFSPDGKTIATGSDDRTVRLWDTATGQEKVTLRSHTAAVNLLAFSRDGDTLATASADGTVRLWRASQEPEAKAFRTELNPDEARRPLVECRAGGRSSTSL
jgi:WD40 repeat protein